jgi:predicted Holliday junction resolvase-like endonuclease
MIMDFLFILFVFLALVVGIIIGFVLMKIQISKYEAEIYKLIKENRKDAVKRSKSVLSGLVNEQLAPYLPKFPYNPSEVKFLGKPIDFLVFRGLDKGSITDVVFVEVKTNTSALSQLEKTLKSAIENKKVSWYEYRLK